MRWWKFFKAKKWRKDPNLDPVLVKYLESFDKEPSTGLPLDSPDVRYVVFDTEATGFDEENDRLLSIGAVSVRGKTIDPQDSFYELIRYERAKGKDDISVHGILQTHSLEGIDEKEAVLKFMDYLGNSVIVAHHADFDVDFIDRCLSKFTDVRILNRVIDTAKLADRIAAIVSPSSYQTKPPVLQLDRLCDEYKIATQHRHHSQGDAIITAYLFLKLTAKMKRIGRTKLRSVLV